MLIEDSAAAALTFRRSRAVRHDFRWELGQSTHPSGVSYIALGLTDPAVSGGGKPPLMLRCKSSSAASVSPVPEE
jgi:hypothetical protein